MLCRIVVLCLVLLCLIANLWSITDLLEKHSNFWEIETQNAIPVYGFRLIQIIVGLIPIAIVVMRFRTIFADSRPLLRWIHFRLFFVFVFFAFLLTTIVHWLQILDDSPFLQKSLNNSILVLTLGVWANLVLLSEKIIVLQKPWFQSWEIILFNIAVTLFALEITLTQLSKTSPSPLLWDQSSIESRIGAHKLKPGMDFYNTKTNSQGYHDQEFYRSGEKDFVIALLADSFGVGIVPYDYNFATIAEFRIKDALDDQFDRVSIHNFGIAGTGIDDYAYLLENEVHTYNPDLVLVSVFVGNDLIDSMPKRRNYLDLSNWIALQLPIRIYTVLRESEEHDSNVAKIGQTQYVSDEIPEHIFDWRKEKPSMSLEKFLAYESARLEICNTEDSDIDEYYDHFFKMAAYFQSNLKENLVFVLIPDEFQINDSLYREILMKKPNQNVYDRNYPQKRLASYFEDKGIKYLDLLPVLKKANEVERTYHLQNTHWNSWGNYIAGNAIADFLIENVFEKQQ